jgi:hypothetical protein
MEAHGAEDNNSKQEATNNRAYMDMKDSVFLRN